MGLRAGTSSGLPVSEVDRLRWVEEQLLVALRARGPQTIEQLACAISPVSWAQVFLAIDRLSRSGAVLLRRAGGDYRAWLNESGS